MRAILKKAAKSAFRGGISGAIAMILQVILLMWLRTVINYQYRNGGSIGHAFSTLYADGGILRFYQGAQYALIQGPLSRFGDTAANEGVKELLKDFALSMGVVTVFASLSAAMWRMFLTPLDTLKTTLQVGGHEGMKALRHKIATDGIFVLYDGALGNWAANLVGHYPWFAVNNQLEKMLPQATTPRTKLFRRAFIGLCSSIVSDCCSNSIRVVKTVKQTSEISISYWDAIQSVVESSGIFGLFFRGLEMKLFSNALSSILFSIVWKMLMEKLKKREVRLPTDGTTDEESDVPSSSKKDYKNENKTMEQEAFLDEDTEGTIDVLSEESLSESEPLTKKAVNEEENEKKNSEEKKMMTKRRRKSKKNNTGYVALDPNFSIADDDDDVFLDEETPSST